MRTTVALFLLFALASVGCGSTDASAPETACSGACASERGPAGVPGPEGAPGKPGALGPQGLQGSTGAPGGFGPAGPQGEVGAAGPQGVPGPQGAQGATGLPGAPGTRGATGAAGPAGVPGQPGAAGQQGLRGLQGSQGEAGPQGDPGAGPIAQAAIYILTADAPVAGNADAAATQQCSSGDVALSGSCETTGQTTGTPLAVIQTHPLISAGPGWFCSAHNPTSAPKTLRVNLICLNLP